jgi:phage repressor protein C with HTH and peptisase S24 domain
MEPLFREGDVVILQPDAQLRRGDRVVVKTRGGEVTAKILGRRNEQTIELISLNPAYPARVLSTQDVEWTARIVWASQ